MKRRLALIAIPLLVVALGIAAYLLYRGNRPAVFDTHLSNALQSVQSPHTYESIVETKTTVSGRELDIVGSYALNFDQSSFASYGTTTLVIPENPLKNRFHSFTLQNIAIGRDVYVKVDTRSPLLKKTIPFAAQWRHFRAETIPAEFTDIAVAGPVLDNLALLQENGSYLLLSGAPRVETDAGSQYRIYRFTLSKKSAEVVGGTLKSLIDRIGTGTVDIWLDGNSQVRYLVCTGDNYVSTTTILRVNSPLDVVPPSVTD